MKEKYIILLGRPPGASPGGTHFEAAAEAPPAFEISELDYHKAAALSADRGVQTVVPALPMQLIAPVEIEAPVTAAQGPGI